jgi:hypothetical protein
VPWLAASLEGFNDEHAAATARARLGEWLRRRRSDFDRRFGHGRCQSQEFAHSRDRLGAVCAGEQAVAADAMEAFGQHVDQQAADELADVERHRRISDGAFDPVILDLERDAPLDCNQAAVRDGDVVRVGSGSRMAAIVAAKARNVTAAETKARQSGWPISAAAVALMTG